MAVAVDLVATPDIEVAVSSAATYAARGSRVLEIPLLEMVHVSIGADVASVRTVVAVEDRTVELILDEGPIEAVAPAVWALAARGWNVIAIVASARNGEAHRALRGTPCMLQPWWIDAGEVRFGGLERP